MTSRSATRAPDPRSLLSFDVPAGARVGISGATGAGKTTLVNLLTRFYDPVEGRILLDGVDLRDINLKDLQRQFAIVLQEPCSSHLDPREHRVRQAEAPLPTRSPRPPRRRTRTTSSRRCRMVRDRVGERGMRLSGGERQRLSLARAFLKDAPILILDEPTSSVDVRTESEIIDAMERLMDGRTTFMIAHRLSTLDRCDIRIEIAHGEAHVFAASDTPAVNEPVVS